MNKINKILLVDDNENLASMLSMMLKLQNFDPIIKYGAENLLQELAQLKPDLILMDMFISGIDGSEVCKLIKNSNSYSQIPIFMFSAHPLAKDICLKAGADEFIEKPFEMDFLISKIKNQLIETEK